MKVTVDELDEDERATLEAAEQWIVGLEKDGPSRHVAFVISLGAIIRKRFPKPATNEELAKVIRRGLESQIGLGAALDAIDELVRRAGKQ
jgi:hypothetical protein